MVLALTKVNRTTCCCSFDTKRWERQIPANEDGNSSHIAFAARPSMLSTEHPDNNYRGFVNVIIILLILANMRIVIQVREST